MTFAKRTPSAAYRSFTTGALRRAVLEYVIDLCAVQRIRLSKRHRTDENYVQRRPFAVHGPDHVQGLVERIEVLVAGLVEDFPAASREFTEQLVPALAVLRDHRQDAPALRAQFDRLHAATRPAAYSAAHLTAGAGIAGNGVFQVQADADGVTVRSRHLRGDYRTGAASGQSYLEAVTCHITEARANGEEPTADDTLAVHLAYTLINDGERLPSAARPWGSPGFRDTQTYMSVTDPGEGHLFGTTRDAAYLNGVIVHVEHLERGLTESREDVEPYRIPIPRLISRVRLHTGGDAPVSSYVGRPMFEGGVRDSMLKTVHTTAAACSSLFGDGLTECKLAIEHMTAAEAIAFMEAVVGNVRRNRHTQTLSAAFNLNTPIVDDRPETVRANGGSPVEVTDRFSIGLLGIELTAAAGFDKVTWDGTADTYPSRCVIEQLAFEQAVTLVHRAHEAGLLTYFSAGFRFAHLADITYTGTDGVGVGGAQILRFMDKKTGHHGPFKAENIARILELRDQAADAVLGRGAAALARLDQMFFEKSITVEQDTAREALYRAQALRDEAGVAAVLDRLGLPTEPETEEPVLASALRLIEAGHGSMAAASYTAADWSAQLERIERAAATGDADWAAELLAEARSHLVESAGRLDRVAPAARARAAKAAQAAQAAKANGAKGGAGVRPSVSRKVRATTAKEGSSE